MITKAIHLLDANELDTIYYYQDGMWMHTKTGNVTTWTEWAQTHCDLDIEDMFPEWDIDDVSYQDILDELCEFLVPVKWDREVKVWIEVKE